jgi:hypothetical protein
MMRLECALLLLAKGDMENQPPPAAAGTPAQTEMQA